MDINDFVVSRSNYVIQEKHQDSDKGTVFERDITTIGGKNYFDKNNVPVYNSGNFIITTSTDVPYQRPTPEIVWDTAPDGSNTWNWDSVVDTTEEEDKSISIELNPDVYDLRNFAYYGSCVELMRGSINHIVNTFPGEIYGTNKKLTIFDKSSNEYKVFASDEDVNLTFVDNPFDINLHEEGNENTISIEDDNYLKFFNYGEVYKNYEFFENDNKIEGDEILNVNYASFDDVCVEPFGKMGIITIKTKANKKINIHVYKGEMNSIIYLSDYPYGWHIRPKRKFYDYFKSKLSLFEKALMNDNTTPKYSPKFDVYKETEYGFETQLQTFSFPLGDGGYNLGISSPSYAAFVGKLTNVANFYDEYFSDNLYRSMTHEAIKNFDWSFKRNYTDDEEDTYLDGGGRLQKVIRLIGREFDEIKLYIDGISNSNTISYNKENNLPDYFLSDMVENNGWDYNHVVPSTLDDSHNKFIDFTDYFQPYNNKCVTDSSHCYALEPILTYVSENKWTPAEVNNLFSRLLILNSRYIWRKKGTKDSIDSILSLFGFKNKEWVDKMIEKNNSLNKTSPKPIEGCECGDILNLNNYSTINQNDWDYYVEEHVSIIDDPIDTNTLESKEMLRINSNYKLIAYEEDLISSNTPTDWRGLMVREVNGKLYPYFNKNVIYDGNPYYQMNGGWLHKECFFDINDNLVEAETFTETINKVKTVENIQKLLSLPYSLLNDDDIYYVKDLASNFIVIDGRVYDLKQDKDNGWYYFEVSVANNSCIIGNSVFEDNISFAMPSFEDNQAVNTVRPLNIYPNGSYVKIYVKPNGDLYLSNTRGENAIAATAILNKNKVENSIASNYFLLNDKNHSNTIILSDAKNNSNQLGWIQLTKDDARYKKISITEDYYLGNNPHTATYKNDFGYEYMKHFINLFTYAHSNNLFDWGGIFETHYCIDETKEKELSDTIKNFGFKSLINENDECMYKHQVDSHNKVCGVKNIVDKTKEPNMIGEEESNKTINTKLVEIYFKCDDNDDVRKSKIKYIDSIVLPYLTQILPSSLIIKIKYV